MKNTKPKKLQKLKTRGIVFSILAIILLLIALVGAVLDFALDVEDLGDFFLSLGSIFGLWFLGMAVAFLVCHAKIKRQIQGDVDLSSVGTKGMRKTGLVLLFVSIGLLVLGGTFLTIALTRASSGYGVPNWVPILMFSFFGLFLPFLSASIAVLVSSRYGDAKVAAKKAEPKQKAANKTDANPTPVSGNPAILANRAGMILSFAVSFLLIGVYGILCIVGKMGLGGPLMAIFLSIGGVLGFSFLGASIAMYAIRGGLKKQPSLDFVKARKIDVIFLCVSLVVLVGGVASLLLDIYLSATWHMIVFVTLPLGIIAFALLGVSLGRFISHRMLKSEKERKAIYLPVLVGALVFLVGLVIDLASTLFPSYGGDFSSFFMFLIPAILEGIGGIMLLVALIGFLVRRSKKKKASKAATPASTEAATAKPEAPAIEDSVYAAEAKPEASATPKQPDNPAIDQAKETFDPKPETTDRITVSKQEPKPAAKPTPKPAPKAVSPAPKGSFHCPHCGTVNKDGASFCSSCGKPLDIKKVCFNCYEMNDPRAVVCSHCGSHLD